MSATGEDQDYVDALLVECGLKGCAAPARKPCVNSVDQSPRDEPHMNRVVRGRRANNGEEVEPSAERLRPEDLAIGDPQAYLSTSALLRQTQQDLAASQADLTRAREEVKRWSDRYAEACRAGHVIQAELASARTELEQLRAQLAAHPDGGDQP